MKKDKESITNYWECRANCNHDVSFYKPEYQTRMKYLLDTICVYQKEYQGWSTHIFHRELAEKIDTYIEQLLAEYKK